MSTYFLINTGESVSIAPPLGFAGKTLSRNMGDRVWLDGDSDVEVVHYFKG